MNENHIPTPEVHDQCAKLIAKPVIDSNHVYTADDVKLAKELLQYDWAPHIHDFLSVVAGIAHPEANEPMTEAAMSLFPLPESK